MCGKRASQPHARERGEGREVGGAAGGGGKGNNGDSGRDARPQGVSLQDASGAGLPEPPRTGPAARTAGPVTRRFPGLAVRPNSVCVVGTPVSCCFYFFGLMKMQ